MKKITFLALHLGYGGIERCITTLANSLVEDYDIEIISTYKIYDKPIFPLDDRIKVKYLMDYGPNRDEIEKAIDGHHYLRLFKELKKARKVLKLKKKLMIKAIKECRSNIIISTRDIHNLWLGKYGSEKAIKIGWEHNYHNNNHNYIRKILNSITNLDYFVLVSKDLQEFYQKRTKTKCIYIPNAIDSYPTKYASLEEKSLVSVGRLSHEKGFDDLIDVFKLVNNRYPDWKLNIIGDGSERAKIEAKILNLNLTDKVILHGYRDKKYVNAELFKSSIYVLPSRSESFGLVILEAFSYGLPCIAFERANGAKNLISNGWNGYLIKDSDKVAMAKRICELIGNINRRVIMGTNALKEAQKYNPKKISKEWVDIFNQGKRKETNKKKVIFISSTGGHLNELLQLQSLFNKYDSYLITEKTKTTLSLQNEFVSIDYLKYGTRHKPFKYIYVCLVNTFKSIKLYHKIKPDCIITTGAHTCVPLCLVAKIHHKKIIYIETFANMFSKTITGRIMYHVASVFVVQWESMLKLYPKAVCWGWIF